MKTIVLLITFATFTAAGVIHDGHHHQATSYQSIHMEHFHPVPTYLKKEDMHYLEHPVSEGMTDSKIEVHHGNKHEPGYAVAAIHSEIHGHHGGHKFVAAGGHSLEHHEDEHQPEVKQYVPQYHGGYSEEAGGHDEGHESQSAEEPRGHYQYSHSQESSHEGDENASYYQEGQAEGEHASYEQGHEESGEHY